ncbi:MAG TPA: hypothetical protein VHY58_16015 [Streptosporangiaceae bacterium]|nr:hypothetical protein [Streptosporangiaceae bacterium]
MTEPRFPGAAAGPQWWRALPPAQAEIPCGLGRHQVRWAGGRLVLPAHPDAEAELVLAALGGERAACTDLAGAWDRHTDDLDVLALGPRSQADQPSLGWDDVELIRSTTPAGPLVGPHAASVSRVYRRSQGRGGKSPHAPIAFSSPAILGRRRRGAPGTTGGPGFQVREEDEGARGRRIELLTLFALGPAFRLCLAAEVVMAWAGGDRAGDLAANRPALVAALTGRLAPAVAAWLGVEPDGVTASLYTGAGWGRMEVAGDGAVVASLPLDWLARVWACGLAVADGHLVVGVQDAEWPDARVLALAEPGADPVSLALRADGAAGRGWAIVGR